VTHKQDVKCRRCTHTRFQHSHFNESCTKRGCYCIEFDGRTEAEIVGQRMQTETLSNTTEERTQAWRMAGVLLESYGKAEPDHNLSKYPTSFVATFFDMALALLDSEKVVWHDHTDKACCPTHNHHVSPHRRCVLR
jgi:hypothetical protein